jgi:hypothetical protein
LYFFLNTDTVSEPRLLCCTKSPTMLYEVSDFVPTMFLPNFVWIKRHSARNDHVTNCFNGSLKLKSQTDCRVLNIGFITHRSFNKQKGDYFNFNTNFTHSGYRYPVAGSYSCIIAICFFQRPNGKSHIYVGLYSAGNKIILNGSRYREKNILYFYSLSLRHKQV